MPGRYRQTRKPVSATASSAVKNLLILPPFHKGSYVRTHRGRLSGLYAWTAAHAMIESNDGKITQVAWSVA